MVLTTDNQFQHYLLYLNIMWCRNQP